MKYLKIENNQGFYQLGDEDWKVIDGINKEDLMILLDKLIVTEFEMDIYAAERIANKAHQIIYRNLYEKFFELLENTNRFKDESVQLYKKAIEKYSDVLENEK